MKCAILVQSLCNEPNIESFKKDTDHLRPKMTDTSLSTPIRGPPEILTREDLQSLLAQAPTLETDLMDFLLIAGYGYAFAPIFERSSAHVRAVIKQRYRGRRAQLDKPTKMREGRVESALLSPYASGEARTIGDLKRLIEDEGRFFRDFRYGSLATLNKALLAYGLDAIKVSAGRHVSESFLKRYGLEKYHPR